MHSTTSKSEDMIWARVHEMAYPGFRFNNFGFATFGKNSKFKMAAIFENFFKSWYSVFLRYPGG